MNTPTFPILERYGNFLDLTDKGMTLRDYFAAQALRGILQCTGYATKKARKDAVELAYDVADEMLAARKTNAD